RGVGRAVRIAEPPPHAPVAAGCIALAHVGEAQPRHVGQQHHVRGDHDGRLAGAVVALERRDALVPHVVLVEHALPGHEHEVARAYPAHGADSRLASSSATPSSSSSSRPPSSASSAPAAPAMAVSAALPPCAPVPSASTTWPAAISRASAASMSCAPRTGSA